MRVRLCVLSVLATCLCGCFGTSWRRNAGVLKDTNTDVELERMFEGGAPKDAGFAHPADIPTERLKGFFAQLKYEQPKLIGDTEYLPVVAESLMPKLVMAIAEGLARAGPAERVRFSVVNTHYQLGFLPKPRTTRGVVFVKPQGTLNVAFDLIDETIDTDMPGERYTDEWGDPTRYTITRVTLVMPKGTEHYCDFGGTTWHLWITVPVEALAAFLPPPVEKAPAPPPAAPPQEVKSPEATPDAAPPNPLVKLPVERAPGEQQKLTGDDAMRLMKNLDELRRKGVITEDEYRAKVEEVLRRYEESAGAPLK